MDAQDRLLTKEEAQAVGAKWNQWDEILARRQDAKVLEALRPVIEESAGRTCLRPVWLIPYGYKNCGHCATCLARALLTEMDARLKGKEG